MDEEGRQSIARVCIMPGCEGTAQKGGGHVAGGPSNRQPRGRLA